MNKCNTPSTCPSLSSPLGQIRDETIDVCMYQIFRSVCTNFDSATDQDSHQMWEGHEMGVVSDYVRVNENEEINQEVVQLSCARIEKLVRIDRELVDANGGDMAVVAVLVYLYSYQGVVDVHKLGPCNVDVCLNHWRCSDCVAVASAWDQWCQTTVWVGAQGLFLT